MKSTIKIEKVSNGYIVVGETTGIKKVATNKEFAAMVVVDNLVLILDNMKDGEIKTLEFDVK